MSWQMTIIAALGLLFVWFVLGIIGFFMEAKMEKYMKFDKGTIEEFFLCVLLGLIAFLCFASQLVWKRFVIFMDKALLKMNHIEEAEEEAKDEQK